jgi:hypothetical protein
MDGDLVPMHDATTLDFIKLSLHSSFPAYIPSWCPSSEDMSSESGPDLVVSRVEWVGHVKIGSESNTKMFSLATDVVCKERNCPTKTVRRVHKGLIADARRRAI